MARTRRRESRTTWWDRGGRLRVLSRFPNKLDQVRANNLDTGTRKIPGTAHTWQTAELLTK